VESSEYDAFMTADKRNYNLCLLIRQHVEHWCKQGDGALVAAIAKLDAKEANLRKKAGNATCTSLLYFHICDVDAQPAVTAVSSQRAIASVVHATADQSAACGAWTCRERAGTLAAARVCAILTACA
jgi:hypothetical protein